MGKQLQLQFVLLSVFTLTETTCPNIWTKTTAQLRQKSPSGWGALFNWNVFQAPYSLNNRNPVLKEDRRVA